MRTRIPASWIAAVLHAESRGDARAVSSAGAMGLPSDRRARCGYGRRGHRSRGCRAR
ncbi:transglycosylase SLT domain-containing protein [Acetobacter sp.]|uniref:transglycosylase SLT domain-containing protein n=1 Tax=Acetobacter sp. TaxID=440 RepID=UPI0025C73558|nr:transglycosylase SLT domain-containing protein [Acetobacter sp.]MCH4089629.1 transglycosylase SLT domain-containing protein [Acetobacter sp.]MCI1300609.1 transglycosylase SLT domain-containing protein [Acetobacter sp.]MCI1317003.1 transglycosylase SLT domain-containing protein [Acetobacter sp.]